MMSLSEEIDDNSASVSASPKPSFSPKIAHEESIEVVSNILAEMEEDELPVQCQPVSETFQPASQVQPSFFNTDLPCIENDQPLI